MKVKVGDKVKILAGKDKGKEGTVTVTLKKKDKVVVSRINIVKKHMKPNAMNETGGIVSVEAPIHVSNVKVIEGSKSAKSAAKVEKAATKTAKTTEKKTTKKTTKKEVGEDNE
ncbi:MAG: 50S ribosomal protein L24 [Bacilli bacterium]|nr:50S ribosomal protein L24 [Bacilli bacterium]